MSATFAIQQTNNPPDSRFWKVVHRIADRMKPQLVGAFMRAVEKLQGQIDENDLLQAVASGNINLIAAASRADILGPILATSTGFQDALVRTSTATGEAGAAVLSDVTDFDVRFNAVDRRVVMHARRQTARLVKAVSGEVKESIRIIVSAGHEQGLTTKQQARAIREMVPLRDNWAMAPTRFANELAAGRPDTSRLLHDPTLPPRQRGAMRRRVIQEIEDRIEAGTNMDKEWLRKMRHQYKNNLLGRRALDIARTEGMSAANHGLRTGWQQAQEDGFLPDSARKVPIVTPDARLRPTHARVPGLNSDGVPIDGKFRTPWGLDVGPPWDGDPYNCRCSESLVFPGLAGVV